MKLYLLAILIVVLCGMQAGFAQEDDGVVALDLPIRNSLVFNRFAVNPTFTFVRQQNKFFSINNKREWVQFDNAPETYLASYSGRISENIGAGVAAFQQNYGVLTTFGGLLNFAYNVKLNTDSNLAFGLNVGAYKSGINTSNVVTNFDDPSLQNVVSNFLLTVNPGINYGTEFLDFGVSVNNLVLYNLESSLLIEDNPKQGIQAHVMHTGYFNGRGFFDDAKLTAILRSEFRKDETIISGLALLNVPKGIWLQVGYNNVYGVSGGIGLNITKQIALEYNIEKSIGKLVDFGSSHEITLAYRFISKKEYKYSGDDKVSALFSKKKNAVVKMSDEELEGVRIRAAERRAQAKLDAEALKKAEIEAEAQAKITAEQKAIADAEAKAKAAEERKAKEEEAAKAKIEADRIAKQKAEARAKILEQQRAKALADKKAEQEAKAAAQAQAKIEADRKAKEIADAKAEADAQAKKLLEEQQAKEEAERQAQSLAEQNTIALAKEKAEAEALAKIETERKAQEAAAIQAKLEADKKAKEIADAKKAEAEALAKLEADKKAKEELITKPNDELAKSMLTLAEKTDNTKATQTELLEKFDDIIAIRDKDLKDLKEENDLSEQGITVQPKPFKSVTAENNALKAIKADLDNIIKKRNEELENLKKLYEQRTKFKDTELDEVNLFYKGKIKRLEEEQVKAIETSTKLEAKLETIRIATEFEKRRRIKRAAFDNEEDRYSTDRAMLQNIKTTTTASNTPLKSEDFDFGEEQSENIKILKNISNAENGYYLIIAVHSDVSKRNDFVTKVVASGRYNVDFFYDVNTSKYYIYYEKFNNINQANEAMKSKGNRPYNIKMSLVKIEN